MKKSRITIKNTSVRVLLILFAAGILWTGYVQWLIHSSEDDDKSAGSRAVGIVLGAALWKDEPSPALRERLNKAIELYREGKVQHLIVTGGLDLNGSTITEAEGMSAYLLDQGIPDTVIVEEREARSTYENLKFSQHLMTENGWSSAYIVTHTYHGARALDIAEFLDYADPAVVLTDSEVMWMPYHKARETLAFTKWIMDKWFFIDAG